MPRKSKITTPPPTSEPTATEKAVPGFSYAAWYEANKLVFNEDRKQRYQKDPAYRSRVLNWNRESRSKKRLAVAQEHEAEDKARSVSLNGRRFKTERMTVVVGGKSVETDVYSIGALALYLNRSIQVLRLWEADGIIPKTTNLNDKGNRFYTREQLEQIHAILEKMGRLKDQGGRQNQRLRPFVYWVTFADGSERVLALYKVGVLAQALKRTIVTIEQMEAREALPVTPFRVSSTHYRLYTLEMIRAVKDAFETCHSDIRGEENRLSFRNAILAAWTEQGVFGAKIGEPAEVSKDSQQQGLAR